jgi:putative spermidine/putrescine transport system substrate-binding protein
MTSKSGNFSIRRRSFLAGVGGTMGAAMVMPSAGLLAQTGGRVVVGTWGGDYARLLSEHIDQPFMVPQGFEVVQDQAGDPERRAKMLAERRLRRGTADVQALQDSSMYQVYSQGLVEEIDYDRIPNSVNLVPGMRVPYGINQIFSGKVVLYNPDLLGTVPESYADILTPDLGSNLGIIDIQYRHNLAVASLVAS